MADPLLTSLCSICHISTPKYKCPRCGVRSCSLPCIKKHKAWSDCTGERDPTKYIPPSKLRTPAGIDHDYNFLHGIELSVERTERLLIGERGLVQEDELRPLTMQEVKWKTGRDGRKRKVLVTRVLREAKGRTFERFLAQRLRKLNISVLCAPMGMARMKENKTTLNRRTGRINWQVEWIKFDGEGIDEDGEIKARTVRMLTKVMDNVPLYQAYHVALEEQSKDKDKNASSKKFVRGENGVAWQQATNATWASASYPLQYPKTAMWATHDRADADLWPSEKDKRQKQEFQYLLCRPKTPSDQPVTLTRLDAGDCFRDILTNTRVLEFPTIYILGNGEPLPSGFLVGPKDTVPPPQNPKRKEPPSGGKKGGPSKKRRGGKGMDIEEGEVGGEEDDYNDDDGSKGVGLELGDVVAEQSLGEDDSDDDTSSSGTSGSDSE